MRVCRTAMWSILAVAVIARVSTCGERKTMKIAVARFSHETCTFAPKPTTIEDWEYFGPPTDGIVDTYSGYIGGFRRMCDEFGCVELIGITSPRWVRGGSSGNWNTTEAFDKYTNLMAEDIRNKGRFDGLFLALHGAMAVTGIPKPEAEIVRRLRKVVGKIPIMVTLDPDVGATIMVVTNNNQELADKIVDDMFDYI